jgi:hypothetical protein
MVCIDMELPENCWDCGLTKEDRNGLTVCAFSREALYPMCTDLGNKRMEGCPLHEYNVPAVPRPEDVLKEYQELEEQGLLYRKVYYIGAECSRPSDCDGACEYCDSSKLEVKSGIIRLCDMKSGEHFLTEADAEQALQARK